MIRKALLCQILFIIFCSATLFPSEQTDKIIHVSNKVAIVQSGAWNNNLTAIKTDRGYIIVDTLASPTLSAQALQSLGGIKESEISYVINTHCHWDHSFGNSTFPNAELLASSNFLQAWMKSYGERKSQLNASVRHIPTYEESVEKDKNNPEKVAGHQKNIKWLRLVNSHLFSKLHQKSPDIIINGNESHTLNGLTIDLYPFYGHHTETDLIILVREEGVLFTGDLFSAELYPYFENVDYVESWISVIEKLKKQRSLIKKIISGHGPLINPDDLFQQLDYIEQLFLHVKYTKEKGLSMEESRNKFDFSPYQKKSKHTFLHKNNFNVLWENFPKNNL